MQDPSKWQNIRAIYDPVTGMGHLIALKALKIYDK